MIETNWKMQRRETTMTDDDLTAAAAKAAGLVPGYLENGAWHHPSTSELMDGHLWNPLADDGDALRLAVKLGISLQFSGKRYSVSRSVVFDICCEWEGNDRYALIRRMIVKEAALLARSKMP
jgi:hypothetical protein